MYHDAFVAHLRPDRKMIYRAKLGNIPLSLMIIKSEFCIATPRKEANHPQPSHALASADP
jgi:hypothetical protein